MSRFASLAFVVACWLLGGPAAQAAGVPCNNPVKNTACSFNAYDYSTGTPKEITLNTTCRKVSAHAFIFVEDGVFGANEVTTTQLDALVEALETRTPRNTPLGQMGILSALTSNFGPLPDQFDQIPQLYLVITHIPSPAGAGVGAYFRSVDEEKTELNAPKPGSNQHEMIFLEATDVSSDRRLSDLTRELVNLIHWGADPQEELWVKAVLAYSTPLWLGYTAYMDEITAFADAPGSSLLGETLSQSTRIDYGATALFGLYLSENDQLPLIFLGDWLANEQHGIAGFDDTLKKSAIADKTFCDFLHGFVVQNGLNRGDYRYNLITMPSVSHRIVNKHPGSLTVPSIAYSGTYVDIDARSAGAGSTLEVSYQAPENAGILLTVVRTSSKNSAFFEVKEQELKSGGPTVLLFDDIASGPDKISLLTSRCSDGAQKTIAITTRIISPLLDGDDDGEAESEPDASLDGDRENEAETGDADGAEGEEEGILIVGEADCHEVNRCVGNCPDKACQASCVAQGTLLAQNQWQDFMVCLNGYNPSYDNCMAPGKTTFEREKCIHINCPNQLENCALPSSPTIIKKTVSACSGGAAGGGAFLLAALALLFVRRRAVDRIR